MAPLAAYARTAAVGADIIRLIVRLTVLVYINPVPPAWAMVELIDDSPLMVMTYPWRASSAICRAPLSGASSRPCSAKPKRLSQAQKKEHGEE